MYKAEIAQRIMRIIRLCYEINPEETFAERTGDCPTVFLYFSGHVANIEVEIHRSGWRADESADDHITVNFDADDAEEKLDALLKTLGDVLHEKERKGVAIRV